MQNNFFLVCFRLEQFMSYLLFPLFSLFLVEGFAILKKRFIRNQILFDRLKSLVIFSIIFLLCLGTYERNTFWKSDIKLLEDCVKKSPNKIRIHYNLGLAYQRAGLYQEAIESYQRAIELKGTENKINAAGTYFESMDASLYKNLGVAYRKLGGYENAIKSYKEAIRIKPSDPDSFNNLGLAYYAVNKLQEAVDAFRQAIFLKPDDDEFYYNLGVTFNKMNIHRDAVKAYTEAIRINEGSVKAHFNLGISYSVLGERNLAIDQYKILRDLDKERAQKLLALINPISPTSP